MLTPKLKPAGEQQNRLLQKKLRTPVSSRFYSNANSGKELVPAGRYLLVLSIELMISRCYCSPSLSIAISRRFQSLLLTFWVALDSLRLALPIDTSLEARSNELINPVGPARS
ncbi:hypothetical protein F511_27061 [Dorcoceras hygrometricum]|uniref:Uncharacterized protein n=1 Tax=Dorcoceras hygrometricum TaxID=472368 RepID=A0A2Z7BDP0_9LAMI|nr:hypothetical protein F511_27061 [Dorcoceras hygrometricum]